MFVVGGESLIDLVPAGESASGAPRFEAHAGGSPYNCAIALAKLGLESGFLCPISKDGLGDQLLAPLDAVGVTRLVTERVNAPTSLAVVTLDDQGKAQYEFYRQADRAFTLDGLVKSLPERFSLFQVGGFCTIRADDAAVWLEVAREARSRGAVISLDPNVRPSLVDDMADYRQRLDAFFDLAHIIKVSDEDLAALDPDKSIEEHALSLLKRPTCHLVVVTKGELGSVAFAKCGRGGAEVYSPPVFGDTVGAGDSLMAGILARLAENDLLSAEKLDAADDSDLNDMLRFGAVVAGLNCAHRGCNPPTRSEVEAVLATS